MLRESLRFLCFLFFGFPSSPVDPEGSGDNPGAAEVDELVGRRGNR